MELTYFELKQIELIAKQHPFNLKEVESVYLTVEKSFDKTVHVLNQSAEQNKPPSHVINPTKPL